MPFNKVPYTSDFRRCLADIFLHSQKLHLFQIWREKNISLNRDVEPLYMHNDIMPNFICQEGETWQTVFCLGLGKEEENNWNKCKRNLLSYPQNFVHRAVQTLKIKRE